MSAKAREEAVEVVARVLREYGNNIAFTPEELAEPVVDRLLETFWISKRGPRTIRVGQARPPGNPGRREDRRIA